MWSTATQTLYKEELVLIVGICPLLDGRHRVQGMHRPEVHIYWIGEEVLVEIFDCSHMKPAVLPCKSPGDVS